MNMETHFYIIKENENKMKKIYLILSYILVLVSFVLQLLIIYQFWIIDLDLTASIFISIYLMIMWIVLSKEFLKSVKEEIDET